MTKSEKLRATYQRKREHAAQRKAEREKQIIALREIRDNPDASPSERLRAVELLKAYIA
jgi:hypothetical protein